MTTAGPGLYVHFPYCDKRCPYCDFVLATPRAVPSEVYTDALIGEWQWRRPREGASSELATLYIGGGTPSLWNPSQLKRFVDVVERDAGFADDAERTIEANPEQLDRAWLDAVIDLGFNRISLGVQSLDAAALGLLGRNHGVETALAALDRLAEAFARGRLRSFSADLIYGWNGQDAEGWQRELETMMARWNPPHLSLYALTVESRTILGKRVREGLASPPDDALQAALMFQARDTLACHGLVHYEVSSFARPDFLAVHNARYWDMVPWIGLGAGAAGFTGTRRYRNQPVIRRYLEASGAGVEAETTDLSSNDMAFDAIMTGLRRLDRGVVLGGGEAERCAGAIAAEIAGGRLVASPEGPDGAVRIRLTDSGLQFMDNVLMTFLDALSPG